MIYTDVHPHATTCQPQTVFILVTGWEQGDLWGFTVDLDTVRSDRVQLLHERRPIGRVRDVRLAPFILLGTDSVTSYESYTFVLFFCFPFVKQVEKKQELGDWASEHTWHIL